jgi:transcriptional regulator GlxA family with amidase domain
MRHATILALPGSLSASISLSAEMLAAANDLARSSNLQKHTRYPSLSVSIAGLENGVIEGKGLRLMSDIALQDIEQTHLIILPALWRNPLLWLNRYASLIIRELHRLRTADTLICAVGTSSFFLAEAGWLNDQPATTHWSYFDVFAKRYPRVQLKREFLITETNNLFCAGSINAVADLMIHFIEQLFDHRIAMSVASQFSPEIRRPIQLYGHMQDEHELHSDEAIIEAQQWLRDHSNKKINMQILSKKMGIQYRNFNRRFKNATGMTPLGYLQNLRINQARELLKTSNLSVGEIASQVGYEDTSYFCEIFRRTLNQSPQSFRQSVRSKLFRVT